MAPALPLLLLSTVTLAGAALWPRAGQGVLLVLPPGAPAEAAFADPDWRVRGISELGPLRLIHAMPDTPEADAAELRRRLGAVLALLAARAAPCGFP